MDEREESPIHDVVIASAVDEVRRATATWFVGGQAAGVVDVGAP